MPPYWPDGGHAPDGVADVIGDQKRSGLVDGESDRPSPRFPVRVKEIGDDILGLAIGTPAAEGHENDPVAIEGPGGPNFHVRRRTRRRDISEASCRQCRKRGRAARRGSLARNQERWPSRPDPGAAARRADRGAGRNSCKAIHRTLRPSPKSGSPGPDSGPSSSRSLTTVHSAPLSGSKVSPFGLRRPLAKIRQRPLARSTSQIAARFSSSLDAVLGHVAV